MLSDDLHALVTLASELATRAAAHQRAAMLERRAHVGSKSSPTDLVTEVDQACEALLVEGILAARPHDAILGEEGTDHAGTSGVRWIIDPLDGTTNFVYGHPGFGVSVAVEVDGVVEVGVVVDTMAGHLYAARRGDGATRDGVSIAPTACADLTLALIATGFSYDAARRRLQAHVLTEVLPSVRDVRRMGAAAVDLCSVAAGRIDGYYEKGLAPWDLAAGVLIAREAGAIVRGLDGGEPSGDGVVAAAPGIAADLRALLERAGAADA